MLYRQTRLVIGKRLASLLVGTLCTTVVQAQIHVMPGGVDTGDGRDPGNPVGTIDYALSQATAGEEIRLAVGTYNESITVGQSQSLTGDWPVGFAARNDPIDPSRTTLQPAGSDRVILFQAASVTDTLTLDGITITGGDAGAAAIQPGDGGGVCSIGGGALTLIDCAVTGNIGRAEYDDINFLGMGRGGGIYAERSLTVTRGSITNNVATAGDLGFGGGFGGGIFFILDLADVPVFSIDGALIDSNIAQNTMSPSGNGPGGGFGGGIVIQGTDSSPAPIARTIPPDSDLTITNSTISNNSGRGFNADDGNAEGGGIWNSFNDSITAGPTLGLRITDSTIVDNSASDATQGLILIGGIARGGGIFSRGPVVATIDNSEISGNVSEGRGGLGAGSGGGFTFDGSREVTIGDSVIGGNTAAQSAFEGFGGGGEFNNVAIVDIQGNRINRNTALENPSGPFPTAADGGGLHVRTDGGDDIIVVNNVIANNSITNLTVNASDGSALFIQGTDSSDNIRIVHNTIFNGETGNDSVSLTRIINGTSDVRLNILDGGDDIISVEDAMVSEDFNIRSNFVDQPFESTNSTITGGTNDIDDTATFLNPGADDFRLVADSVGVDDGVVLDPPVTDDIDGVLRDDGMPDIGAHEFMPPPQMFDFGDAPDSYFTTLASDGPRHLQNGNTIFLGTFTDSEPDGQPDVLANGDDSNPAGASDDEDAVVLSQQVRDCFGHDVLFISGGDLAQVELTGTGSNGFVYAWIDFNADGFFDEASEKIIDGVEMTQAQQAFPFSVPPAGDRSIDRFARFRISSTPSGVRAFGEEPDGEVEDYLVKYSSVVLYGISGDFNDKKLEPNDNVFLVVELENNDMAETANDVVVRLSLEQVLSSTMTASGLNLASIDGMPVVDQGSTVIDMNNITWNVGDVNAGALLTMTIDLTVLPSANGLLRFTADTACSQDVAGVLDQFLAPKIVREAVIFPNGVPANLDGIINAILMLGPQDPSFDTNNDGNVNSADVVRFVNSE